MREYEKGHGYHDEDDQDEYDDDDDDEQDDDDIRREPTKEELEQEKQRERQRTHQMKRIVVIAVILVAAYWIINIGADCWCVLHDFQKPVFARAQVSADGGASNVYEGAGYSFTVSGDFAATNGEAGATQAEFYLFGNRLMTVARQGN